MSFSCITIPDFLSVLSSDSPTPGGGGASALVGSIGISLGLMVGALTKKNPRYSMVEPEILLLMEQADRIQQKLFACIDADAAAFEPLSHAYQLPKDSPDRDAIMESCLKKAATVPLDILHLCAEAIELEKSFSEIGSRMAVSDAATGIVFCMAALEGAAVNVRVNTKYMKDRAYAEKINAEVENIRNECRKTADLVFSSIYEDLT